MWDVAVRLREMRKGLVTLPVTRPGFEMSEQVAANNGFSVLTWKRKSLGFLNIIDYGVSQNSCFLLFVFVFKLDFWRYGVEVPGCLRFGWQGLCG